MLLLLELPSISFGCMITRWLKLIYTSSLVAGTWWIEESLVNTILILSSVADDKLELF